MSVSLLQSRTARLLDIVDSYKSGSISPRDLVSQMGSGIRQLEHILHTSNYFLLALDAAKHYSPIAGRPIFSSTLSIADSYRVTLLGIPTKVSIPVHDHPDMISVVAFLSGKIHSPIYGVASKDCGNLVKLKHYENRVYSEGDVVVLMPEPANLHGMEALTAKAVCLSVQLSITPGLSKQTYFFPAVPKSAESEYTLWFRMLFRGSPDGA
jgi:hypothetical protein